MNMYEALGGETKVRELACRFYDVMDEMPEAATIRAMHREELGEIKELLFEFLSGWLGGPPLFIMRRGSPCLNKQHRPFPIDETARDQWLMCMDKAMNDVNIPQNLQDMLRQAFFHLADAIRVNTEKARQKGASCEH